MPGTKPLSTTISQDPRRRATFGKMAKESLRTALVGAFIDSATTKLVEHLTTLPETLRQRHLERETIVISLQQDLYRMVMFWVLQHVDVESTAYEVVNNPAYRAPTGRVERAESPVQSSNVASIHGQRLGEKRPYMLMPSVSGDGLEWTYKGTRFRIERTNTGRTADAEKQLLLYLRSSGRGPHPPEPPFELRAWTGDPDVLEGFLQEAARTVAEAKEDLVEINYLDRWHNWVVLQERVARPLESVILPRGLAQDILQDAQRFLARRPQYSRLGIPWRRTYMLEGPPGTGKSALAEAIAGELGVDLYGLSLADGELNDSALFSAIHQTRGPSIILIEDVDSYIPDERTTSSETGVSFSGILNILDGATAPEGRIFILTTNKYDDLDEALQRRAHRTEHIGYATSDQVRRLTLRFFPGEEALAEAVVGAYGYPTPEDKLRMKDVEDLLKRHLNDPDGLWEQMAGQPSPTTSEAAKKITAGMERWRERISEAMDLGWDEDGTPMTYQKIEDRMLQSIDWAAPQEDGSVLIIFDNKSEIRLDPQVIIDSCVPCPFCGQLPQVMPKDPKSEGDTWGMVRCWTKTCPVNPSVQDMIDVAAPWGSDFYRASAVLRWNRRILEVGQAALRKHLEEQARPVRQDGKK